MTTDICWIILIGCYLLLLFFGILVRMGVFYKICAKKRDKTELSDNEQLLALMTRSLYYDIKEKDEDGGVCCVMAIAELIKLINEQKGENEK